MFEIRFVTDPSGKCSVKNFIDSLSDKARAKTEAIFDMVETMSPVPSKIFKPLKGTNLYEIRVFYRKIKYRYLCFLYDGSIIMVSHVFIKKSQKIPQKEIRTAEEIRRRFLQDN